MNQTGADFWFQLCEFPQPANAAVVALRRAGAIVLLVGNVGSQPATVPFNVSSLLVPQAAYDVYTYNNERDARSFSSFRVAGGASTDTVDHP